MATRLIFELGWNERGMKRGLDSAFQLPRLMMTEPSAFIWFLCHQPLLPYWRFILTMLVSTSTPHPIGLWGITWTVRRTSIRGNTLCINCHATFHVSKGLLASTCQVWGNEPIICSRISFQYSNGRQFLTGNCALQSPGAWGRALEREDRSSDSSQGYVSTHIVNPYCQCYASTSHRPIRISSHLLLLILIVVIRFN